MYDSITEGFFRAPGLRPSERFLSFNKQYIRNKLINCIFSSLELLFYLVFKVVKLDKKLIVFLSCRIKINCFNVKYNRS